MLGLVFRSRLLRSDSLQNCVVLRIRVTIQALTLFLYAWLPQKMNEASSLLRATCSQFICTLEECMKFANTRLAPELYHPSIPQPSDFVGTKLPHSHRVRFFRFFLSSFVTMCTEYNRMDNQDKKGIYQH